MIHYDKNEEPIVISKPTSDRLLKLNRPADAMALYWFYYYTAKWQHTNSPHANNHYVTTGLKWANNRLSRAKKDLINLGLIEQPPRQWNPETKKIGYPQIKINFIWWDKTRIASYIPEPNFRDIPISGKPTPEEILPPTKSNLVGKLPIKGSTGILKGNTNKLKRNTNSIFFADDKKFDPEDLPIRLAKHPTVVKAWAEFVLHRKQKKCPLTPLAWKKCVRNMLPHSPKVIVAAIDKSIQCGWRGLFFDETPPDLSDEHRISLDPDAQLLYAFLDSMLGDVARPEVVHDLVFRMKDYYATVDKLRNPYAPDHGPTDHMSWRKFFDDWLEFLREKQDSHFELRSINDLRMTGCRWQEYIRRCEEYTCYNWTTGKRKE